MQEVQSVTCRQNAKIGKPKIRPPNDITVKQQNLKTVSAWKKGTKQGDEGNLTYIERREVAEHIKSTLSILIYAPLSLPFQSIEAIQ